MKHHTTSEITIEDAAQAFAALGSEQRLGVLRTLVRAGPEGLSIGVLGQRTGISGSTLTHHVKFLSQAKLLKQVKHGRSIICTAVAYDMAEQLSQFVLQNCCADAENIAHENHEADND